MELIKNLYSTKTTNIKDIVDLHLYSNLSINDLARLCQMSLSTFKREFKKKLNVTPLNYITNKRLEKAQRLLRISTQTISEIAHEIGYNDPQYFTRIFKKHTEYTPSAYRDRYKK